MQIDMENGMTTENQFKVLMEKLAQLGEIDADKKPEEVIRTFFLDLLEYTGAQSVSVFEFLDETSYQCAFECTMPGSFRKHQQKIYAVSSIPEWYEQFQKGKSVQVLGEQESALLVCPIRFGRRLLGFIQIEHSEIEATRQFQIVAPVVGGYLESIWFGYQKENVLERKEQCLTRNEVALKREREFLEVLCRDYTSVYYVDLSANSMEPLKIDHIANAARMSILSKRSTCCYTETVEQYCSRYVIASQTEKFRKWLSISHLKEELSAKERFTFRYQCEPNLSGQQFFEAQVVRVQEEKYDGKVLMGFRHIDNLVASEQKHQQKLEESLEKVRLSNEILSAIGKIYYVIFRIDLERDFYEEVVSDREVHYLTGKSGKASDEMEKLCNTFVVPEYREQIREFFDLHTLQKRLEKEETVATEYLAMDGNWHTSRFIVKRRNRQGKATHVLYVRRLISDIKRREQHWIALAEEANKTSAAKTEFISQIAHDIRTPMNAIMGFAEITSQHIEEPEKVRYGLEKIKVAGSFLQELVSEVLDISRMENGKIRMQPCAISLKTFFKEFQPALDNIQMGKNLKITCTQHDLQYDGIIADPLRLKQIYTNILSNAVKYTPAGGKIDFEVYQEKAAEKGKIRLVSIIQDTGIGMSPEYMKNMYDKFSRGTDTRINKVPGYGLGLSIVKQLVDLMQGRIEVESELGKGTCFKVILEFACTEKLEEEKPDTAMWKKEAAERIMGMRLLVAEDNDLNYEVVSEILKGYGITCDRAENGQDCLEKFEASKADFYDAILMDMQMPVMNGVQAAAAIRALPRAEAMRIPIIAVTANAFPEDVKKCMAAGMDTYMSKPIDVYRLLWNLMQIQRMKQELI